MRKDWIEVELGEAFNITYGKGLSTKDLLKEGYPVYGANGVIGYYSDYKYEERQVLISCRGAASGKINISPEKCFITNNSLIVESSSDFISKEYLYFILSGANRSKIVTGSAQPQVTINNANPLIIKLAALPIQRAIVSKIEALFSDLDNGIANFKKAQEQLKIYRQAVLKKAFEGELTKEWREKQVETTNLGVSSTALPTAEELLKQIKEERKNHISDNLPKAWKWVKLGEVIEKPKYGTSKKCDYKNGNIGVLRIPNISNGFIDDSDLKFADFSSDEISDFSLIEGDILTIRSNGSVDLVGKCGLIKKSETKYLFAGYLIRLRPIKDFLNSHFLLYLMSSIDLRVQIESFAKSTSGVNNINSGELSNLVIPLCSLQEQSQIVQEIENRLSVCDKMEQSINESIEKAEALRQSILKKAFEGRLLSAAEVEQCKQAADYEPASELLKKIKAEKVKTQCIASQQKKSTTKKKSKK